jgi:diacylglycerol kinase (ATP)
MALLSPPRRALLVVNPASRRGAALADRARRSVEAEGVECDVVLTERAGHAAELAVACLPHADLVLTLGGDGTAMEVVGALAGRDVPVGLLAGGTGNQVVRALGIPLDVPRAVRALLRGRERPMDLGRLSTGRHFALAVGVGPDVAMIAETSAAAKRRFGTAAYAVSAVRAIRRLERFDVTVTVDGTRIERSVTAVMMANLPGVENGRVTFGPGIAPDDGWLDLCLYDWHTVGDALNTFWRAGTGRIASDPSATFFRGRDIEIHTSPVRDAEADGELIGPGPVRATVAPLAARMLVP